MKSVVNRKLTVRILLAAAAFVVTHALLRVAPAQFQTWNARLTDQLYRLESSLGSGPAGQARQIVHIDANFYYTRSAHAEIIRTLSAAGVQVQLIDTVFHGLVGDSEDRPLIEAIAEASDVLLGISFDNVGKQPQPEKKPLSREESDLLNRAAWGVKLQIDPADLVPAARPTVSNAALAGAAAGQGVLNLPPDPDGVLRRVPLLVRYRGAVYPSIALLAVCRYLEVSEGQVRVEAGCIRLRKPAPTGTGAPALEMRIPIDRHGHLIIDFTRLRRPIPHYSYSLLSEAAGDRAKLQALQDELHGKIAVVSETVDKRFLLPPVADERMRASGEVQAAIVANILSGQWIRPVSFLPTLAVELGLLALLVLVSLRDSSLRLTAVGVAVLGLYPASAFWCFDQQRVLLPVVGPMLLAAMAVLTLLAAIGVENALLFSRTEKARQFAERELEIGRLIQAGFFPTRLPEIRGWELQSYFKAARHVAGDFYDAYTIGDHRKLGIIVADVCDKGVGAALFMALFRSLIRVLSGEAESEIHLNRGRSDEDAASILRNVFSSLNRYIAVTHDRDGMFATVFFGILDPATGRLRYVNAGHEPAVVLGSECVKAVLAPTGPAVGLDPAAEWVTGAVQIESGEMLVAYTDGIVEACNSAGEFYSRQRLLTLMESPNLSVGALIQRVHSALEDFVAAEEQHDDITLVALRRKSAIPE